MNKLLTVTAAALVCAALAFAQAQAPAQKTEPAPAAKAAAPAPAKAELKAVKLKEPDMARKGTVMDALSKRASGRSYSDKKLTEQDISDLLWAANGVNRPDGRRTAPSARNAQDVDVYVVMPEGAYIYNAQKKTLDPIASGDFRAKISPQQEFVATAPVNLILVSDISKLTFGNDDAAKTLIGAMDAGIVSQNIAVFCAAAGLATVPRAMIDQEAVKKFLKLKDGQKIMLNHPVGYPK